MRVRVPFLAYLAACLVGAVFFLFLLLALEQASLPRLERLISGLLLLAALGGGIAALPGLPAIFLTERRREGTIAQFLSLGLVCGSATVATLAYFDGPMKWWEAAVIIVTYVAFWLVYWLIAWRHFPPPPLVDLEAEVFE